MSSLRALTRKSGETRIKKVDGFRVSLKDLKVEEGFNLRVRDADLEEHIEGIVGTILQGGYVPPVVVRVDDDENLILVDGHCRREAYLRAVERGAPIDFIDADPFKGNDVDRVLTMMTSAQGKPLSPLEQASGVKRLRGYGFDNTKIAQSIGKTASYVDSLLMLADSPHSVQQAVASGKIAAKTAVAMVREHGEGAKTVIGDAVKKAEGEGKSKVTPKMLGPKAPAKKLLGQVYAQVSSLRSRLPVDTLARIDSADDSEMIEVPASELKKLIAAFESAESSQED